MADRPVRVATPPKAAAAAHSCPIGDLFRLLGEAHVLNILHFLTADPKPRRFVELQKELRMSPNTLTDRLHSLVGAGLLKRTAFNEIPPRVEYEATAKAIELESAFTVLEGWARRHDLEPEAAIVPSR